ncbi:ADAMTS-like protein 1 isoform X6 [Mercenaria mercenaria]|uniref:ADAMTS-like protein 1 isoform X6 n=1 Tax=Mercenaria mercenaria TaxID=6596 RepID=UPI00234F1A8E|nr:ADAMTS-like protein 1 isoform X6 [Mercenaria mercenaria]
MDINKVVLLSVVCVAVTHIQGTLGFCNTTETPSINMCQTGTHSVGPGSYIYLDSAGGAPSFTKVECNCTLSFSGSGTLKIAYRSDQNLTDDCGLVNYTIVDRTWGCNSRRLSTTHKGSNNLTYIKAFDNVANWQSCLGLMSPSHTISVQCYPFRIYYAPDEVVNGQFGDWSNSSGCSMSCGTGTQTWVRRCDDPAPRNNGTECLAQNGTRTLIETEVRQCTLANCPVNGEWGQWLTTSPCSTTCGNGTEIQTRSCDSPAPQNGGTACLATNGETVLIETRTVPCFITACPVNGGWGSWSNTSPCSATCGNGTRTQTRSCDSPSPQNGGNACLATDGTSVLEETQTIPCFETACPVDGGYTDWSAWTACTKTCGGGSRGRSRTCTNPTPQNDGLPCNGSSSQTEDCNTNTCPGTGTSQSSGISTPTSTSTTSTPSSTPTASATEPPETGAIRDKDEKSNIWAIVGGVIGGLLFLLLLLLLIICLCRRRRRKEVDEKRRPSTGPRSIRYLSHGDDVTVTENELYHYDGETPSHATNALFVGGIPETPNSPNYIPHFSTGTGDSYAVIVDSNRKKPKSKERPKLDTFNSQEDKGNTEANGDVRASADTVKLADNYNEDNLGRGVENPGYDDNYIAPYDSAEGETKPKTSTSSPSPYDYIDNAKLQRDDEDYENEKLAGDYATLPDDTEQNVADDTEESDRYKRFISSEPEESPDDDGYMKSPKRDKTFEFPDTN